MLTTNINGNSVSNEYLLNVVDQFIEPYKTKRKKNIYKAEGLLIRHLLKLDKIHPFTGKEFDNLEPSYQQLILQRMKRQLQ